MPWSFVDAPNFSATQTWTTTAGSQSPDFFAFLPTEVARLSLFVSATGMRPGYEGPIGRAMVGVVDPASGRTAFFMGTGETIYPGIWYTFGIQQATTDYIWGVRADWPRLGSAFWSNGKARGGTWILRGWNA